MQEENIHIRWANGNDAEDLLKLNDAFNGVGTTLEEVKESLALSNELIALAVIDGQAVGFACAQYFKSFCYRGLQEKSQKCILPKLPGEEDWLRC